ncbi:hypothetical protein JF535_03500 [Microbulbifer salipaludis]|uniref:Zinc-finger domain-containing protein n=1 Tax=Microbulbifer salipaludis TaxID=187980 RepID=A0ABS3E3P2_9GAMM|nr:hypothetical protein [Microbulbifer salipaludis]MBN8429911.1 hypothetical protein [Microbulbifer salipaludis]
MMNCCQARRELDLMQRENNSVLLKHLHRCSECREYAEELRLVNLLRTMPAPQPSEYFEERVLNAAMPKRRNAVQGNVRKWQLATAASVLFAVIAALPQWRSSTPIVEASMVQASASEALPVRVSVDAARAMEGALISVSLPENLALEGYGDQRELSWRTNLNAGANRLTLPVRARTGQRNEILIRIEHDGARKEFYVPVEFPARGDLPANQGAAVTPQTI